MLKNALFTLGILFVFLSGYAQNFSNKGKDFWVGYGYHESMNRPFSAPQDMVLYFTSDVNANVKVEIPAKGWVRNYQVTANSVTESDTLPKSGAQDARLTAEGVYDNGIHISSDHPIVAYAHIYSTSVSGATLLFPVSALGQDYYSLNFTQRSFIENSNSWVYVVATEDNTEVEIIPSGKTLSHAAGQSFSVTLNKGQIYNLMGETNGNNGVDLSGTRIRSISTGLTGCKKIAVFSGSGRASISCDPSNPGTSDNLIQQVFPRAAWGRKYLTAPTSKLTNNYFRIAVSDPATVVTIDGVRATNLVAGFYYEISANVPKSIVADKPVMVAQYITSTNECSNSFNNNGDPEMIYLSPVEQTIDQITLNSTSHFEISSHYINVIIKSSAVSSFTLDGNNVAASFAAHPKDPAYSFAVLEVKKGAHNLKAAEGFNAIAYGYGPTESYGYNAGTNIKDLYQFITLETKFASVNFPATCKGVPFRFLITLPYQPSSLVWDFGNNPNLTPSQKVTQTNPVADSTYKIDGRDVFAYRLPSTYQFSSTGTFPVKILSDNQSSDGCNGLEEISYDIEVTAAPVADFTISGLGCAGDSLTFIDASDGKGKLLTGYRWDLGDGTTDTLNTVRKIYAAAGVYNIKHTAINDIGCFTDTTKSYVVAPVPVANFGVIESGCVNSPINFTDSSKIAVGNIVKWYWNFGDGTANVYNNGNPFTKSYNATGDYIIQLAVETDKGCRSDTVQRNISVKPLPVTNFIFNEICVNDPFAQFTDSSYVPGVAGEVLSYSWNFGDPNATIANPDTSILKNPQHKYAAAGAYNVSLTSKLGNGCSSTVTKPFIVSSGSPNADFLVQNSGILCGNAKVEIQNVSSIGVGRITKLEILWDSENAPTETITIDAPAAGGIYSHIYPSSATTQTYKVKVRAYSGLNCVSEKVTPIEVNANPTVIFDPIPEMCLTDNPRMITQARETSGISGTFAFSGKGISPDGLFSPAVAGAGNATISYVYTSSEGCTDSVSAIIPVVKNPTVELRSQVFVLEGGSIVLDPQVTGSVTRYTWSPPTYLDNANIENPRSTPKQNITYRLTVSTAGGCTAFDDVTVSFLKTPSIPNAFSPNGDGINDVWNIASLDSYENCVVQVFNRYGQLVFNEIGYKKPWNGTFNGSILPVGVYYYVINVNDGLKPFTGSITIIK